MVKARWKESRQGSGPAATKLGTKGPACSLPRGARGSQHTGPPLFAPHGYPTRPQSPWPAFSPLAARHDPFGPLPLPGPDAPPANLGDPPSPGSECLDARRGTSTRPGYHMRDFSFGRGLAGIGGAEQAAGPDREAAALYVRRGWPWAGEGWPEVSRVGVVRRAEGSGGVVSFRRAREVGRR